MLLYHGSRTRIDAPSLAMARGHRDFGRGLYLAERESDSLGCCLKGGSPAGFLHIYEADPEALLALPGAVAFDGADDGWLRLVFDCRMHGRPASLAVDPPVVAGPTAGRRVNELFRRYRREGARFEDCVAELRAGIVTDRFGTQWCLRTDGALSLLELVGIEEVRRDDDMW